MQQRPGMSLHIIRLAMGAGLLTFGTGAYIASRMRPPDTAPAPENLTWAAWGIWGVALTALTAWRLLRAEQVERRDPTTLIVGWAIGEVPALFGAAYLLVTGQPALLLAGYVVFSAAMLLFPARRG